MHSVQQIIYIDITQLEKQRVNTGIQRVVKEFLQKALKDDRHTQYKIIKYNTKLHTMELLENEEVKLFVLDIKNFQFTSKKSFKIETLQADTKIKTLFFDLDSGWNAPYKRAKLYPILKNNGFLICNFLYDMIPILLPQFVHETTIKNFKPFIDAVYKYSDLVMWDSSSAQKDFLAYQKTTLEKRTIATQVVGLGSNFIAKNTALKDAKLQSLLDTKYILFVGTLEPRKNQEEVLSAFDRISQKYPDLHLILIGMKGWKIDHLIKKINSHPLKNKRLFWLEGIDDDTLFHFYKNAFIVTYLSKYEGYGLPIVESLQHAKVTLTSNNSSMPEVGCDFADYIDDSKSVEQLVEKISFYYENTNAYEKKQTYIQKHFHATTWNQFYEVVIKTLIQTKKTKKALPIKQKLKNIPVLGAVLRTFHTLLTINRLKQQVIDQKKQLQEQKNKINTLEKKLEKKIAQHTSVQYDSLQQRVDQMLFDAKIESTHNNEEQH